MRTKNVQLAVFRGSVKRQSYSSFAGLLGFLVFYSLAFFSLLWFKPEFLSETERLATTWSELMQVVQELAAQYLIYSTLQATLSATLILVLSWITAKSLGFLPQRWQSTFLALTNLSFSLPTILVVYALLAVLGTQGWFNQLLLLSGIERVAIYGLVGIVLANVYFNWGYATNVIWSNLQQIPQEYYELALSCRMNFVQRWRWVEFPQLKSQLLNLWLLLFLLCFNSFALILFLGGGPKYANLEVAIYQALMVDLDFAKASMYALLQLGVSALLIGVISWARQRSSQVASLATSSSATRTYLVSLGHYLHLKRWGAWIITLDAGCLVLIPLLTILCAGVGSWWQLDSVQEWWHGTADSLTPSSEVSTSLVAQEINPHAYDWERLGLALRTSLWLGCGAAVLSIILAVIILRGMRWHAVRAQALLQNLTLLSLAVPSLLLGAGYYLLLTLGVDFELGYGGLVVLLILANTANSLVFALNFLAPVYQQIQAYNHLVLGLRMSSWQSFVKVEWRFLQRTVWIVAVNVFILTIGDFSIIIFFATQDLTSLTYLLSLQMGGLQATQGNITALVLLVLVLVLRLLANFYSQEKLRT